MYQATYRNAQSAFEDLYHMILEQGINTNVGTKALYNVGVMILNPNDNKIKTPWRKWSESYAKREWKWYLSKDRSVENIKKFAPTWDKMHNGDNIVNSNYGWQWSRNDQLAKVIEKLKSNKDTRQAWLSIYDGKEIDDYAFDTPCTIGVGFKVNNQTGKLDIEVLMRSNDLIYGFCNDTYCFSNLQMLVAKELELEVGTYFHYASDLHIYESFYNMKADYDFEQHLNKKK